MYLAHLTPGYFAAQRIIPGKNWTPYQRGILCAGALISTFAPDLDVIYNVLINRVAQHLVLWTHSLLLHGNVALIWLLLNRLGYWHFAETLIGLVAIGGLSHLLLDMIVHNTPIFYPISSTMYGLAPSEVAHGGIRDYITHPIFLLEPLLLSLPIFSVLTRNKKR